MSIFQMFFYDTWKYRILDFVLGEVGGGGGIERQTNFLGGGGGLRGKPIFL